MLPPLPQPEAEEGRTGRTPLHVFASGRVSFLAGDLPPSASHVAEVVVVRQSAAILASRASSGPPLRKPQVCGKMAQFASQKDATHPSLCSRSSSRAKVGRIVAGRNPRVRSLSLSNP
jgi:hypothetical protein